MFESGSTARNATARISTARHFFRNLDCSTEKCHLLNRKKYAVCVPRVNFEQMKKSATTQQCRAVETQFFATVKYKSLIFFRDDKIFICCTCS